MNKSAYIIYYIDYVFLCKNSPRRAKEWISLIAYSVQGMDYLLYAYVAGLFGDNIKQTMPGGILHF